MLTYPRPTNKVDGGFCKKEEGAAEVGAKRETKVSIELWLDIFAKIFGKKRDFFSYKIFELSKMIEKACWPLNITRHGLPETLKDMSLGILEGVLPFPGHDKDKYNNPGFTFEAGSQPIIQPPKDGPKPPEEKAMNGARGFAAIAA